MAFLNETGLEQVWDKIKTKVSSIENTIDDINEAKVDKVSGKGLSTNDFTTDEKNKLAGIATGATKVIVDSTLSNTSTNAIQNKVVANMKSDIDDALSAKLDTITTSGDGNIITDISKSGTTINAEKNAFATTVKEGNPVSEIGAAGAGFSVKTTFEPKQEGSGDPSPSNIRTISGWTGAKLTRCGKNMLKNTATSQTINGVTFTVNIDGSVTVNGTATAHAYFVVGKSTLSAGAYIVSGCPANGSNSKYFVYADYSGGTNDYGSGGTFTLAETKEVAPTIVVRSGTTVSNLTFHPMIRLASETDAAFVVYQGETLSATFNQTVYGGILDWQTGVLTVDRALYTFDGSEGLTSGGWNNPYSYVLWAFLPDVVNCGMSDIADAYCSHYIVRSVANVITDAIAGFGIYDSGHLIFSSPTHADADAFKSYLAAQYDAGTPVQVCYKLAAPTTIQLTPQDLRMLDGTNTVYSDGTTNYVIFNSGSSSLGQVDKNYLKLSGGTMTGTLKLNGACKVGNGGQYTYIKFCPNFSSSDSACTIYYNTRSESSFENPRLMFRQFAPSSSGSTTVSSYYDDFYLPPTTAGQTTYGYYDILTSKSAVTISQGGTGATSASGARTNLEVPSKTGNGASGTWGISISGNASTASKLGTSTIGDTQTPIYLNGGTPTICSTYNNRIYAYDGAPYYTYSFGGGQDLNWKKIFSASDTATAPSSATYHGATIKGKIFYTISNYNAGEVREYDFVMYANFINATSIADSCILKVSAGCPDTIIRAVRVSTNSFELQVRQPTDWHKICVQFCYRSTGATVSHCAPTDSSNSDVIPFSALTTSKYISDANNGTPITLRYGGSGLSSTSWLACWDGYQLAPISPSNVSVGSASKLATARTLTIGNTGKSFDGSGNVSWSLSEIGAAASNHTHSYLPLSGGTITGNFIIKNAATWPNLKICSSSYSTNDQSIIYYAIPANSAGAYFGFRQYSRSSSDYTLLSYYENFILPNVTSNRTSNADYNILTTKYTVTVAQGGTGSTTKSGARTNLGITSGTSLPSASGYAAGDIFILY